MKLKPILQFLLCSRTVKGCAVTVAVPGKAGGVLLVARAVFVQQSSAGQRVSLSPRQQRRSLFQQHWKGSHAACLPISPR